MIGWNWSPYLTSLGNFQELAYENNDYMTIRRLRQRRRRLRKLRDTVNFGNPDPFLDGTKNKKTTFVDIIDTIFWRHSTIKAKQDLRKVKQLDYLNYKRYRSAQFYDDIEQYEAYGVFKRPRPKRSIAIVLGQESGVKKAPWHFRNKVLPHSIGQDLEDCPTNERRYIMKYGRDDYNFSFDQAMIENSHLKQPKKYVIMKTMSGSAHYAFNNDISDRLLSDDFLTPYFTSAREYSRFFVEERLCQTRDRTFLHPYWEDVYEFEHFELRSRRKLSDLRRDMIPDMFNEDIPFDFWNKYSFDTFTNGIMEQIIKQNSNLPVASNEEDTKNIYKSPLLDKLEFFFDRSLDYMKLPSNNVNLVRHYLNNFYQLEKYTYHRFDYLRKGKKFFDNKVFNAKSETFFKYFYNNPGTDKFFNNDLNLTELFTQKPIQPKFRLYTQIEPTLDKVDRLLFKDTPIGLGLHWANFWFPGNIYGPFHDYDSTSFAFKARKNEKSLNVAAFTNTDNLLIFLDPQFAKPVIMNNVLSYTGVQVVHLFSLLFAGFFYIFLLFRMQTIIVWLLRYITYNDFYTLRRKLNLNLYPIFQLICRGILITTYYLLYLSLIVVAFKSSLFFTVRLPYFWSLFGNKKMSSRYNEGSPLQTPIRRLNYLKRKRTHRSRRWWRSHTQNPADNHISLPFKNRYHKRIRKRRKFRQHFVRHHLMFDKKVHYIKDTHDRYVNEMYFGASWEPNKFDRILGLTLPYTFANGFVYSRANFHKFRNRIKRKYKYKVIGHKKKLNNQLTRLNLTKMYFIPPMVSHLYSHPLHDLNHGRRILPFRKTFLLRKKAAVRVIPSRYYPFTRINAYESGSFNSIPFNGRQYRHGKFPPGRFKRRRARKFSSTHFFKGIPSTIDKAYWGSTHYYPFLQLLKTLYKSFKLGFSILYNFFFTTNYPFLTSFSTTAYIKPTSFKNRWRIPIFKDPNPEEAGTLKYVRPFTWRPFSIVKYIPLGGFRHKITYKYNYRNTKEYKDYLERVRPSRKHPVNLYRYHRPVFWGLSSISYYFNFSIDILFLILKLLADELFHIMFIFLIAFLIFLKTPNLQPLPSLKTYLHYKYKPWLIVDEIHKRILERRSTFIPRAKRVKKFHYEFWSTTPRRTWRPSFNPRVKRRSHRTGRSTYRPITSRKRKINRKPKLSPKPTILR